MFNGNLTERSVQEQTGDNSSYYSPGIFKEEAVDFLKQHMDAETYDLVMSRGEGKAIPSVLARIYLTEADWKKYVWIEKNGNLQNYTE